MAAKWQPIYIVLKTTGWQLYTRNGASKTPAGSAGRTQSAHALGPPQQGLIGPAFSGHWVQRGGTLHWDRQGGLRPPTALGPPMLPGAGSAGWT
jgi:hypothetical protein